MRRFICALLSGVALTLFASPMSDSAEAGWRGRGYYGGSGYRGFYRPYYRAAYYGDYRPYYAAYNYGYYRPYYSYYTPTYYTEYSYNGYYGYPSVNYAP